MEFKIWESSVDDEQLKGNFHFKNVAGGHIILLHM